MKVIIKTANDDSVALVSNLLEDWALDHLTQFSEGIFTVDDHENRYNTPMIELRDMVKYGIVESVTIKRTPSEQRNGVEGPIQGAD